MQGEAARQLWRSKEQCAQVASMQQVFRCSIRLLCVLEGCFHLAGMLG